MTLPGRRSSLVTQTVLLTTAVAAIAVLVAGIVSYPLVRASTLSRAQAQLAQLADLTTAAIDRSAAEQRRSTLLPPELAEALVREEVQGYLVFDADEPAPGMTREQNLRLFTRRDLSAEGGDNDRTVLIEGRPLARGGALVLQQDVSVVGGSVLRLLSRFALALVVGLLLATGIGVLVARRISRPLRNARDAAYEMASGERGVRLEPSGPVEVAGIADSLNHLSDALAASERRQREFLLSVSHEFRTPLTGVRGYAEALADGVVPDEDVARTGATLVAEAGRLDRLVSDLLDLARMGADNFRVTPVQQDLTDIAADAANVWTDRCAREGVTFTADIAAHPVPAFTDAMRVRQIIDNLAENALRVSPAGSTIVLAVRAEWPWAVLEVRDSGPGLTADDLGVAFDPGALYERYRGVRPVGTGLGLALVARLAASLHGTAVAGQAAEGGARFIVRLPSAPPEGAVMATDRPEPA